MAVRLAGSFHTCVGMSAINRRGRLSLGMRVTRFMVFNFKARVIVRIRIT